MPKAGPDKRLCLAQRPNQPVGVLCQQRAGWGTDHPGVGHCRRHGGATESHKRAAQREIAQEECARLAVPIEIDPGEALLQELYRTWGWIKTYELAVDGLELTSGSLWSPMFHQTGGLTGEVKAHILVELMFRERQHAKDVAAAAIRAGVEQRRLDLEERRAELIAEVFRKVFADREIGLSKDKQRVALAAAGRHLRLVAA